MPQDSRKTWFVDPAVQGTLVRRLLLHWFAFMAVGSIVSLALLVFSDPFQPVPWKSLLQTLMPFLVAAIVLIPIFLLDTVQLSHRWAGPLVRIRHQIREMSQGHPVENLTLRPDDFWQDLASDLNVLATRCESTRDNRQRVGCTDASTFK